MFPPLPLPSFSIHCACIVIFHALFTLFHNLSSPQACATVGLLPYTNTVLHLTVILSTLYNTLLSYCQQVSWSASPQACAAVGLVAMLCLHHTHGLLCFALCVSPYKLFPDLASPQACAAVGLAAIRQHSVILPTLTTTLCCHTVNKFLQQSSTIFLRRRPAPPWGW